MAGRISFAARPALTGERVLLRPLTVADVPDVLVTLADADALRLTGTRARFTADEVEQALRDWTGRDDRLDMAVVDRATGAHAGEATLDGLDRDNGSCGLRIMLAAPFTEHGLGTEATRLLLGHAFDTVGVHRVELEVYEFNPRARHVYEKVGFVYEGTRRHALRWHGEWIDAHVMGMLADDWAARRAARRVAAAGTVQSGSVTKSIKRSTAPTSGVSRSR
jgi:RimJ/RimL family protein N-acetyltransferase